MSPGGFSFWGAALAQRERETAAQEAAEPTTAAAINESDQVSTACSSLQ